MDDEGRDSDTADDGARAGARIVVRGVAVAAVRRSDVLVELADGAHPSQGSRVVGAGLQPSFAPDAFAQVLDEAPAVERVAATFESGGARVEVDRGRDGRHALERGRRVRPV